MHVTDLCPKWLLNGEWAANRETRMYKHKEGNSGSQRVTLTRHRRYTPEMTLFLLPVDNYHIFFVFFFVFYTYHVRNTNAGERCVFHVGVCPESKPIQDLHFLRSGFGLNPPLPWFLTDSLAFKP